MPKLHAEPIRSRRGGFLVTILTVLAIGTQTVLPAGVLVSSAAERSLVAQLGSRGSRPRIASGHGVSIVAWQSANATTKAPAGAAQVLTARSRNGGRTWSAARPIHSGGRRSRAADQSPQLTTDKRGRWLVAWWSDTGPDGSIGKDSDILMARSADDGLTWSATQALNTNASTDTGWDYVPQLATDGHGAWVAVWWSDDTLGNTIGKDYDILVARSSDHGRTWTVPRPLNTNAPTDAGDDRCPQVATDGRGRWLAVWESTDTLAGTVGPDKEILVARSLDDGRTWSDPTPLDVRAGGDADVDAEPRLATDGYGVWVVVWHATIVERGMLTADSRILAVRSTDGGATWGPSTALTPPIEAGRARSALQPVVAVDPNRVWAVAWWERRNITERSGAAALGARIMIVHSKDGGLSWSAPEAGSGDDRDARAPDMVAATPRGMLLAWEAGVLLRGPTNSARTIVVRSVPSPGVSARGPD